MGTWVLKKEEIPSLIQELEAWEKHAYHIGAAIRRLKKLSAAERGNYDVSRCDPQFTGTKLDADFHPELPENINGNPAGTGYSPQ